MDLGNMSAADWRKIFKFKYVNGPKTRDSYAAITGYKDTSDVVEIPERIGNATVIEISENAFKDNKYIKTIVLPETIIRIFESAFEGCKKLQSITMGDQVEEIRWRAFKDCTALTTVSLPPKVTKLDSATFEGCKNLESVKFSQIHYSCGDFEGCDKLRDANDLVIIDGCVLGYLGQGERVVIPEGTKRILSLRGSRNPRNEYLAFSGIKELVVPASVEFIGKDAYEPHIPSNLPYEYLSEAFKVIAPKSSKAILHARRNRIPYKEI